VCVLWVCVCVVSVCVCACVLWVCVCCEWKENERREGIVSAGSSRTANSKAALQLNGRKCVSFCVCVWEREIEWKWEKESERKREIELTHFKKYSFYCKSLLSLLSCHLLSFSIFPFFLTSSFSSFDTTTSFLQISNLSQDWGNNLRGFKVMQHSSGHLVMNWNPLDPLSPYLIPSYFLFDIYI